MSVNVSLDRNIQDFLPVEKLQALKGEKLLLVIKNGQLRWRLKILLNGILEIYEALTAEAGLEIAAKIQPVAIIAEQVPPLVDGVAFCKSIKGCEKCGHITFMIVCRALDPSVPFLSYSAGADACFTGPLNVRILIHQIINIFQSREKLYPGLQEQFFNKLQNGTEQGVSKREEEFLKAISGFVTDHIYNSTLDAKTICVALGISKTVLYARIKRLTGQTVHEYIKSIRLERSLSLLAEGSLSVSQVAYEVGFNSHSYFDKCFFKRYGKRPKEYAKMKTSFTFLNP